MDIFLTSRGAGSKSGEWSRKPQSSCQRKLNFYSSTDIQGLPNVKLASPTTDRKGIPVPQFNGFRPSPPVDRKAFDNVVPLDPKENKKTVARRHLIGSLSAPMKPTGGVRTSAIGRSIVSPPRGYLEWKQYVDGNNFHTRIDGDNLQGVDKMENVYQRRLDLKLQKPAPFQITSFAPVTSNTNNNNNAATQRNNTLRKPLYWNSDVAKLSDVTDLVSEKGSEETIVKEVGAIQPIRSKMQRVDWSQHRPLTPNLLKKLNNLKISTIVKTQHWVNKLPQDSTLPNRHVSTPNACAETPWGRKHSSPPKTNHPWIYGAGR